jgi:uncharacterized protein
VVESCVNRVGVEVNTASAALLAYVAGVGPSLAENIVRTRDARGGFRSRRELLEVPRLGAKAFEQAAGFLRVHGGAHPLDASAVHPSGTRSSSAWRPTRASRSPSSWARRSGRRASSPTRYVSDDVGLPTLRDILAELRKPGRDPRDAFELPAFRDDVKEPKDLVPGMVLEGVVTNIVAFGAFVDVGVHQDGLVHVSQLADRYVTDANQVVRVGQKVRVTVQSVDLARGRIALTMKGGTAATGAAPERAAPGAGQPRAANVPAKAPARAQPKPAPAFVPRSGAVAPNGIRFR